MNMLAITDDSHLALTIHLDRIRAISDAIMGLDKEGDLSLDAGLRKHTILYLAETIQSQAARSERDCIH